MIWGVFPLFFGNTLIQWMSIFVQFNLAITSIINLPTPKFKRSSSKLPHWSPGVSFEREKVADVHHMPPSHLAPQPWKSSLSVRSARWKCWEPPLWCSRATLLAGINRVSNRVIYSSDKLENVLWGMKKPLLQMILIQVCRPHVVWSCWILFDAVYCWMTADSYHCLIETIYYLILCRLRICWRAGREKKLFRWRNALMQWMAHFSV